MCRRIKGIKVNIGDGSKDEHGMKISGKSGEIGE